MNNKAKSDIEKFDIFIIGGGVNGAGILRDAVGRGFKVGLAEMNDFGSATSSSSTKLFHGGLRYLESYQFRLVKESLVERDILMKLMPHISWPLHFVLPYNRRLRPYWLLRLGLYFYDFLAGTSSLPKSVGLNLRNDPAGKYLKNSFKKALQYSDCWVEDSRLVFLNIKDALNKGGKAFSYSKVTNIHKEKKNWLVTIKGRSGDFKIRAPVIINAMGPWVGEFPKLFSVTKESESVRLVKGSHIVVKSLFNHKKAYIFQGSDGRIIFCIPYEENFTLIGTTEVEHDIERDVQCSMEEKKYLCEFASKYFKKEVSTKDIVWEYSGVRALYEKKGVKAKDASRDYFLDLRKEDSLSYLSVYGGKLTSYRKLSEKVVNKISKNLGINSKEWTSKEPLPGGDFKPSEKNRIIDKLIKDYGFLTRKWAERLFKTFGTETPMVLAFAKKREDMGRKFGYDLTEKEVNWFIDNEFVYDAEDLIWRRTKIGLRLSKNQIKALDVYIKKRLKKRS